MYWQVYLHKTSVAAEKMLVNILKRAKELAAREQYSSDHLHCATSFIKISITKHLQT